MSSNKHKRAARAYADRHGIKYTAALRALQTTPQYQAMSYARSTDPRVLSAVEDLYNLARYISHARAELVERLTGDPTHYLSGGGGFTSPLLPRLVSCGVEAKPTVPGPSAWKRGPRGEGWVPSGRHPDLHDWEALANPPAAPDIPGLPPILWADQRYTVPAPFLHDGAAWVKIGNIFEHAARENPSRTNALAARYWAPTDAASYDAAYQGHLESWEPKSSRPQLDRGKTVLGRLRDKRKAEEARDRARAQADRLEKQSARALPTRARYAKSTDPDVVAAVKQVWTDWERFHVKAVQFVRACTGGVEYVGAEAPSTIMHGVRGPVDRATGWVRDRRTGAWRPAKGAARYRMMEGLGSRWAPVFPGAEWGQVDVDGVGGDAPFAFVVGGVAWADLGVDPAPGGGFDGRWGAVPREVFEGRRETFLGSLEVLRDRLTREGVALAREGGRG